MSSCNWHHLEGGRLRPDLRLGGWREAAFRLPTAHGTAAWSPVSLEGLGLGVGSEVQLPRPPATGEVSSSVKWDHPGGMSHTW